MTKRDRELLDDVFLQPRFLSRDLAFAIRRMLPPEHRHRMRFFFDDYGCMRCGTKDAPYGSNALCKLCMQEVKLKLFLQLSGAGQQSAQKTFLGRSRGWRTLSGC